MSHLWDALPDLDDSSASTSSVLALLAKLIAFRSREAPRCESLRVRLPLYRASIPERSRAAGVGRSDLGMPPLWNRFVHPDSARVAFSPPPLGGHPLGCSIYCTQRSLLPRQPAMSWGSGALCCAPDPRAPLLFPLGGFLIHLALMSFSS
jgi:hypothetical protein